MTKQLTVRLNLIFAVLCFILSLPCALHAQEIHPSAAGNTDVGRVRAINQDNFVIIEDRGVYVVADGMGGHAAGEVASLRTVDTMRDCLHERLQDTTWMALAKNALLFDYVEVPLCIERANNVIFAESARDLSKRGMGTTVLAIQAVDGGILFAHVGDSRIYRMRNQKFEQMTVDHSLANEYIRQGLLDPKDLPNFPYRNIMTRALGTQPEVEVDVSWVPLQKGDLYLLCSDGLFGEVPEPLIQQILIKEKDLNVATQTLINLANIHGGHDNITAVLVQY